MRISTQFIRFAVVGLASNALLFIVYLLLTDRGLGHKSAMSLLYVIGTIQTFYFNRRWSFQHAGASRRSFPRYLGLYLTAWIVNWLALAYLVDILGLPHRAVQAVLILMVAALLFLAQRFWVFGTTPGVESDRAGAR